MKSIKNKTAHQRNHLYKLLDTFEEKDLYVIKSFMEFLQKAKTNGDDVFLKRLLNSDFDKEELNEKTLLKIRKARSEVKKKKFSSLDKVMKEFGI